MSCNKLTAILGTSIILGTVVLSGCATNSHSDAMNPVNGGYADAHTPPPPSYSFPATRPATGSNVFIFDPSQSAWAAYDAQGNRVREGYGSGGRDYCSDIDSPCHTPVGTFHVYRKEGADCESSLFPIGKGGAPMPYCMYFHGGFAVHGSYDVEPGQNVSHGCVRIYPSDAEWLSQNFMNVGTTVIIKPY